MDIETMKQLTQVEQSTQQELPLAARIVLRANSCQPFADCGFSKEECCESQSEQRIIAGLLLSIQESERKRIACDLHDGLGQSLTMFKLALAESEQLLASGAIEQAASSLKRLRQKTQAALDEVRQVAMDLRPPMLDDLGILPTLSWFFREFESDCHGVRVEKEFNLQEHSIPGKLKITIFRIIQEATSNIVKYANADRIRVHLKKVGDALHFTIEDNGDGFDPAEVAIRNGSDRGLGLLSMKERANLSGGEYSLDSCCGQGTRISICWHIDNLQNVI
ncbi:MAG: sensor histidine kinase [Sideroxydans sp.]|nr:sensor histidine kinase [Sideroxydans sp.]